MATKPKRCGKDVASRPASVTDHPSDQLRAVRSQSMKHPLQPGSLSGVALRRTRRVDGVEVDRSLLRDAVPTLRKQRRRPLRSAAASAPLEAHAAALGVPERGDGVQASAGVLRPRNTGGARSRAPFSTFHQWLRETDPGSPENGSESTKKPPTAIIPGDESYQRSETASTRRDAARRRGPSAQETGAGLTIF